MDDAALKAKSLNADDMVMDLYHRLQELRGLTHELDDLQLAERFPALSLHSRWLIDAVRSGSVASASVEGTMHAPMWRAWNALGELEVAARADLVHFEVLSTRLRGLTRTIHVRATGPARDILAVSLHLDEQPRR